MERKADIEAITMIRSEFFTLTEESRSKGSGIGVLP